MRKLFNFFLCPRRLLSSILKQEEEFKPYFLPKKGIKGLDGL